MVDGSPWFIAIFVSDLAWRVGGTQKIVVQVSTVISTILLVKITRGKAGYAGLP